MNAFEQLLQELGELLHIALHPDSRGACKLAFKDKPSLQLECRTDKEELLIASLLGELPAGSFRTSALKEALKYNSTTPRSGTLAYVERHNQLALFAILPLPHLKGIQVFEEMQRLLTTATHWSEALKSGRASPS